MLLIELSVVPPVVSSCSGVSLLIGSSLDQQEVIYQLLRGHLNYFCLKVMT